VATTVVSDAILTREKAAPHPAIMACQSATNSNPDGSLFAKFFSRPTSEVSYFPPEFFCLLAFHSRRR
jgi:hypothetical protein